MQTKLFLGVAVLIAGAGVGLCQEAPACAPKHRVKSPSALRLLTQKSVQQELKLTDEQVHQVRDAVRQERTEFRQIMDLARAEREQRFPELRKADRAAVVRILSADQVQRLKQISLQRMGGLALLSPHVSKDLAITDQQKEALKGIQKETWQQARKLFKDSDGPSKETRAKFLELRLAANTRMQAVLTAEQTEKWKTLTGEPFKGEIHVRHGMGFMMWSHQG